MKHIYCLLISCLVFTSSFAQANDTVVSHYLFPEFSKGAILMNDGSKFDLLLNYNYLSEEMIFDDKGQKLAIASNDMGSIDTVFIKDRKFVAIKGKFTELVYHSKWDLYVQHKCELKEHGEPIGYGSTTKTASVKSYSSYSSSGNLYELKLPDRFELEPHTSYWIKINEELKSFSSIRELKKLYKDRKDIFNSYVKEHSIKYENLGDIIQLIEYLETNTTG